MVGASRRKTPFIKSEKRRQGKKMLTLISRNSDAMQPPGVLAFGGTAFSEPTLTKLAFGYEAATQARAYNLSLSP
jgi:hypothetical protein